MKALSIFLMLASATVLFVGCSRVGREPSSQAEQVIRESLSRNGGAKSLQEISSISGTALVKLYDNEGQATIRGQEFTAYPRWGFIQASGRVSGGSWHAYVTLAGAGVVTSNLDGGLSGPEKQQIEDYLRLILHRLRGPMNLLGGGEEPGEVTTVFVASRSMRRIAASGRTDLAKAYFFDERYRDLRLITDGKDTPPGTGTVTVLTNQRVDGFLLPVTMEVVDAGRDSLIGARTRMTVQLQDVRVR